jgi:colanic acid/amylovoran biosynthesis glycosyltransferase
MDSHEVLEHPPLGPLQGAGHSAQERAVAHVMHRCYGMTENWIRTQITHLNRYHPFILCWSTENAGRESCDDLYALLERPTLEGLVNRGVRRVVGYYPSFYCMIRRRRARLIHAHFGRVGHFALRLAGATRVPLVTSFYGYDASRLPRTHPAWRTRYQDLFRRGQRFLVEGRHMGQQLQNLGCPEHKIIVHHLGVETSTLPPKTRYLSPGEPLRVLVAGRFTEKKGIVYAVEAFGRLVQQGVDSRLTIIGDASDMNAETERTKRRILQAIRANDLGAIVALRGMQPHEELVRAYYQHHVFLAASVHAEDGDNEGGAPVTLIEAQATGMPVVATYHCDIPEVVLDGCTGLLAPERDKDALARHLRSFAETPRKLQCMGFAARQHVEAGYDAKRQGIELESIYDAISTERTRK